MLWRRYSRFINVSAIEDTMHCIGKRLLLCQTFTHVKATVTTIRQLHTASLLLNDRPNRPHYRSCPSVRTSVLYELLTRKQKRVENTKLVWTGSYAEFLIWEGGVWAKLGVQVFMTDMWHSKLTAWSMIVIMKLITWLNYFVITCMATQTIEQRQTNKLHVVISVKSHITYVTSRTWIIKKELVGLGSTVTFPSGVWCGAPRKLNFMHFSLKIWHVLAPILLILWQKSSVFHVIFESIYNINIVFHNCISTKQCISKRSPAELRYCDRNRYYTKTK